MRISIVNDAAVVGSLNLVNELINSFPRIVSAIDSKGRKSDPIIRITVNLGDVLHENGMHHLKTDRYP